MKEFLFLGSRVVASKEHFKTAKQRSQENLTHSTRFNKSVKKKNEEQQTRISTFINVRQEKKKDHMD